MNNIQKDLVLVTLIISVGIISFGCLLKQANADQPGEESDRRPPPLHQGDTFREHVDESDHGAVAPFDKRMPPVIPGEEVHSGRKTIKVWSTSGSVSASEPPAPPSAPLLPNRNDSHLGSIAVAVDGRSFVPGAPTLKPTP